MKKLALYLAAAVILGLSLTLIPLITIAEIGVEDQVMPNLLWDRLETLEGDTHFSDTQKYSDSGLEVFAISFVIALIAYALSKRRMPRHNYGWIRPYPY